MCGAPLAGFIEVERSRTARIATRHARPGRRVAIRIAQLAPTYERVPPSGYGGTELIVHLLTEELVRRGHDVTLFATGDSITRARLASVTGGPNRYGEPGGLRHPEHVHLANAQACFRAAAEGAFDLVHNHAGIEGMVLAATAATPVLTTNHLAYEPATASVWDAYPWWHHAASAASAATYPARGALAPVHHGIDVASHQFGEHGEGFLLFLGRMAPEKGAAEAIETAVRTGRQLVMVGKADPADAAYMARIQERIDGDRIRFIGEAGESGKRGLLAGADALLFPIAWDEPFGLVVVEALASGTPVIAFRRASVPELIDDGETGFIVDDVDAMVAAVDRLGLLSRRRCRSVAETRFTVDRMVDAYEAHYAEVISGRPR
jgi:glycosyltransferase involved in cell wall biosynthesis